MERARTFWRRWFRAPAPPVDDLYRGLVGRFTGRFQIEAPAALAAAASRVGCSSSGTTRPPSSRRSSRSSGSARHGQAARHAREAREHAPLARAPHEAHVRLPRPATRAAHDGALRPRRTHIAPRHHRGRSVPSSATARASWFTSRARAPSSCRQPVTQLSGSFLEMALAAGRPVAPVRFSGGLPAEPLVDRLELPLGMGRQDYRVGPLIQTGAARATRLPRAPAVRDRRDQRARRVPNAVEAPLASRRGLRT